MAEGTANPLIEALPPATDYLTYLTIIEYNLTTDKLSTLHDVLQDSNLTINIGWDLVHLLVPLLPASDQCLQDIARLGNPREVILKVTECLRLIDYEGLEPTSDDDEPLAGVDQGTFKHPARTAAIDGHGVGSGAPVTQAVEVDPPLPLPVVQFTSLLAMLSVLHPRVKTMYPSRFISTSLRAILASFSNSVSHQEELVSAVVRFVKNIAGTLRPHLPPRRSSSHITMAATTAPVPDPEDDAAGNTPSRSEASMQTRLLQSFVTHALEEFLVSLNSADDCPGLAWCSRVYEKLHPERNIPGKTTTTERFASDASLHGRLTAVGELLALAQDLGIAYDDLLTVINSPDAYLLQAGTGAEEDEFPKTAADVPLSKSGSLFLFAARNAVPILYSVEGFQSSLHIFPDHRRILENFTSASSELGVTLGTEPEAILDAVLVLAIVALENDQLGQPADTEQFNRYLQILSLISANSPSPSIRYHAFYLATTILRSNPSDAERLAFIRDTLEHCPFENLKVGAVSWIKGEIIEANLATPLPSHSHSSADAAHGHAGRAEIGETSIFATPVALDTLSPFLFPDLTHDLASSSLMESWMLLQQYLHFYLASLNFYYLLLTARQLHGPLGIGGLHTNRNIAGRFLQPLREAAARFRDEGKEGGQLGSVWDESGDRTEKLAELELLDATLDTVTASVARLNKT